MPIPLLDPWTSVEGAQRDFCLWKLVYTSIHNNSNTRQKKYKKFNRQRHACTPRHPHQFNSSTFPSHNHPGTEQKSIRIFFARCPVGNFPVRASFSSIHPFDVGWCSHPCLRCTARTWHLADPLSLFPASDFPPQTQTQSRTPRLPFCQRRSLRTQFLNHAIPSTPLHLS